MAELLQAEADAKKESVASACVSNLVEGKGLHWVHCHNVHNSSYWVGSISAASPVSWVIQHLSDCTFNPDSGCGLDKWVVRKFGDSTVHAYTDTAEEGIEFVEASMFNAESLASKQAQVEEALEPASKPCPRLIWKQHEYNGQLGFWMGARAESKGFTHFDICNGKPHWSIEKCELFKTATPRFLVQFYPGFNCVTLAYVESVEEGQQVAEVDNQERWDAGMQIESLAHKAVDQLLA